MTNEAGEKPAEAEDPFPWDRLLGYLQAGMVVPVIGPDLLHVKVGGRRTLLYSLLAERLAEKLKVDVSKKPLPPVGALHEVACRHLDTRGRLDDVYLFLHEALVELGPIATPEPLRWLARIKPLKLFLTTTFDPLLEQALNQIRYRGAKRTLPLAFLPRSEDADIERGLKEPDPVVFHLFGRISPAPTYAVTEEDTLEAFQTLQSEAPRLQRVIGEPSQCQILLIGNRFPDWLARFLMRIACRQRLWVARDNTASAVLAADHDGLSSSFISFMQRLGSDSHMYPHGPVQFVAELARRCGEKKLTWKRGADEHGTALEASDLRGEEVFIS